MCHHLNAKVLASGVRISDAAPYQLRVERLESRQRAFTLNTTDASAAEFELKHQIRYRLIDTATSEELAGRVVQRQQIYRHSASALIAKDREQETISNQLDNLILDIILREVSLLTLPGQSQVTDTQDTHKLQPSAP